MRDRTAAEKLGKGDIPDQSRDTGRQRHAPDGPHRADHRKSSFTHPSELSSKVDRAARKGLAHPNRAARLKSRLNARLKAKAAPAV
ncbi:MAG: hypothetical protein EBU28_06955 [Gammaproteobacteria bacterium]|nr:hypothetical protein [Gammaproteobacteria bacterium]